jgi:hypothetical protein
MRVVAALLLGAMAAHAGGDSDWLLTLTNGDTLHCRLHAIEGNRLVVHWAVAPDEPLKLDLKAVASLSRGGEEAATVEPPENADILRLNDESVLFGRAVAISPLGVEFEVPQVGRLMVPAEQIIDLNRGRQDVQIPDAKDEEFAVVLRSGVSLAGKLAADDRGRLVLEGQGLTATIEYESLAVLAFPRPTPKTEEAEAAPVAGVEVKLRNGSVIGGRDPSLAEGTLGLRVGGADARVALTDITAIAFRDYGAPLGRSALRRILAWGRWGDPGEEFRRTVDIVKAETGTRWKIVESTTERFDDAFRRELSLARTLLIPEMENLKGPSPDAAEIKPLLETFLRSGGNVVVCGAQGPHLQWLRDAGLADLDGVGQVDGTEVTFTPKGAAAAKGIKTYQAVNATSAYAIKGDAYSLAESGGKPVVVARRVGRGLVIVVGADYYMTNEGASKLLGNVVQLR